MTITAIRPTKRGKIAVEADGEYLCAVHPDAWAKAGFSVGDEIGAEQMSALSADSAYDEAKRKALSMLSARSYTEKTLTRRLARTCGEEAAQRAADRMTELGLLNDEDYAVRYAQELAENRGYAARRIRFELRRRGHSREAADAAIETLSDRDDLAAAVALLRKKYRLLATDADVRRAAALLERCGYDGDVIRTAIHALRRTGWEDND